MKIVAIELLRNNGSGDEPTLLCAEFELSSYGYFQRQTAREVITVFSHIFIKRTGLGVRQSVKHEGYNCHVHVRRDGLAGIIVADEEYPARVAFTVLAKLLDDYLDQHRDSWMQQRGPPQAWPPLTAALVEYQDPAKADKISAIQRDLDETTEALRQTIDSVLERGEKLDELVLKSEHMSTQSRILRQDAASGDPVILSASYEVSSFGYFQRSGVREMINFFSRTFIKRTEPGLRQSIKHEEYTCHVHVRRDGLAGIVVADEEYPPRVAFALLNKLLEDYEKETKGSWKTQGGQPQEWAPMTKALQEYQDPSKADKIAAIQKELDETTAVLSKTIDNVLERGERLDDLVSKSQDLSSQSKVFYKQAKKTNSCCVVM
ncbi:TPA: hypothetical protein N0F65_003454 [Lagenidium giganteum]|uniref:Uncharacterized protein n=1 Tax=Lagenidium giganteum TaxID=4803 RepID=A0AAV2YRE6_9STRA|nr:TPA: hypothetical protein N0F65_003454 [Lagenidium giganteum]